MKPSGNESKKTASNTCRQRLLAAIYNKGPDRAPFICPGGMMNMITREIIAGEGWDWQSAYDDPGKICSLARSACSQTGLENLGVPFCMTIEAEALGAGVEMQDLYSEPRVIAYPLHRIEDWPSLKAFKPENGRVAVLVAAISRLAAEAGEMPIIASVTGPISLAASLIEPMILYRSMLTRPAEVRQFLDFLVEWLAAYARLLGEAGAEILTIADPSASGEILGTASFTAFAVPNINSLLEQCSPYFDGSIVHICGQLASVADCLNTLETPVISIDSATSITALKSVLKNKVIAGNVSTQLLHKGSPEMVLRASLNCIKQGAGILAPACGISLDTPLRNLQAMARAVNLTAVSEPPQLPL